MLSVLSQNLSNVHLEVSVYTCDDAGNMTSTLSNLYTWGRYEPQNSNSILEDDSLLHDVAITAQRTFADDPAVETGKRASMGSLLGRIIDYLRANEILPDRTAATLDLAEASSSEHVSIWSRSPLTNMTTSYQKEHFNVPVSMSFGIREVTPNLTKQAEPLPIFRVWYDGGLFLVSQKDIEVTGRGAALQDQTLVPGADAISRTINYFGTRLHCTLKMLIPKNTQQSAPDSLLVLPYICRRVLPASKLSQARSRVMRKHPYNIELQLRPHIDPARSLADPHVNTSLDIVSCNKTKHDYVYCGTVQLDWIRGLRLRQDIVVEYELYLYSSWEPLRALPLAADLLSATDQHSAVTALTLKEQQTKGHNHGDLASVDAKNAGSKPEHKLLYRNVTSITRASRKRLRFLRSGGGNDYMFSVPIIDITKLFGGFAHVRLENHWENFVESLSPGYISMNLYAYNRGDRSVCHYASSSIMQLPPLPGGNQRIAGSLMKPAIASSFAQEKSFYGYSTFARGPRFYFSSLTHLLVYSNRLFTSNSHDTRIQLSCNIVHYVPRTASAAPASRRVTERKGRPTLDEIFGSRITGRPNRAQTYAKPDKHLDELLSQSESEAGKSNNPESSALMPGPSMQKESLFAASVTDSVPAPGRMRRAPHAQARQSRIGAGFGLGRRKDSRSLSIFDESGVHSEGSLDKANERGKAVPVYLASDNSTDDSGETLGEDEEER